MTPKAGTPEQYIKELPAARKKAITRLRNTILKNLLKGFAEMMSYGMIGYVVPHSIYPAGYHCDPKLPLPFVCIASQKNFMTFTHLDIDGRPALLKWFTIDYIKQGISKLDMSKACIRFKKPEHIPNKLIGELIKKVSVKEWIKGYETNLKPV